MDNHSGSTDNRPPIDPVVIITLIVMGSPIIIEKYFPTIVSNPTVRWIAAVLIILISIFIAWRLRSRKPYIGFHCVAASIAVGVWLLRVATPSESIGFAVGAAFSIVMIWLRRRPGPEGGTNPDESAYLFGEVGIGLTIAIISFIVSDPIIFEDDFSDKSGEWPKGKSEGGAFKYADGGYLLYAFPPYGGTQARAENAGNLGDVIVEVEAKSFGDLSDEGITYWGIVC